MGLVFTNNAEGTLLSPGITDSAVVIPLNSGEGINFPAISGGDGDWFYVTIVNLAGQKEVVKVTHRATDTLGSVSFPCTRGADGSTARAYTTDDKLQLRIPSIVFEEMLASIDANTSDIATNTSDISDNTAALALLTGELEAPANTVMYFYNSTVPSGWTTTSGPADCLLSITGGSQEYSVAGGNVVGSWTPSTHIHTMGTHYHSSPQHQHIITDHTHTIGNHKHGIEDHNHRWYSDGGGEGDGYSFTSSGSNDYIDVEGSSTGYRGISASNNGSLDGGYYTQDSAEAKETENPLSPTSDTVTAGGTSPTNNSAADNTGQADPGDTNAGGTDGTDRPYAAVGLLGTKD